MLLFDATVSAPPPDGRYPDAAERGERGGTPQDPASGRRRRPGNVDGPARVAQSAEQLTRKYPRLSAVRNPRMAVLVRRADERKGQRLSLIHI